MYDAIGFENNPLGAKNCMSSKDIGAFDQYLRNIGNLLLSLSLFIHYETVYFALLDAIASQNSVLQLSTMEVTGIGMNANQS